MITTFFMGYIPSKGNKARLKIKSKQKNTILRGKALFVL